MEEDRPDVVLDQLSFDIPDQPSPLLQVGLLRLSVDQRIDLWIAVSAIISRGAVCNQPWVKGMTQMVNGIYNGSRFEDVWLDK